MQELYCKILDFFVGKPLSKEAFTAYFNRLPDTISVQWLRDGDFIVGKVITNDDSFMTQAKSADEFVDMVNESLIIVYDIPKEYLELIKNTKTYKPSKEEWKELNNAAIKKSTLGIKKDKKVLQLA